ncbi:MAG: hypothetical protein HOW73_42215 [Polyangiaceae bacterium]|nr:hypothetical protein [Polyangiaceae bacterium]
MTCQSHFTSAFPASRSGALYLFAGLCAVVASSACVSAERTQPSEAEASDRVVADAPQTGPSPTVPSSPTEAAPVEGAATAEVAKQPAKEPDPAPAAPISEVAPPADELPVDGANLTIDSVTADGFTLRDLSCKAEGGGLGALMIGPTVAGSLSKKKTALDACAPKGADVRVRFTASRGKIASAEARSGDPKIDACVAKVLKNAQAVLDGTCAASMRIGRAP